MATVTTNTARNTLCSLVAPLNTICKVCSTEVRAETSDLEGKVRWLPDHPNLPKDSCIFDHGRIEEMKFGAFDHPSLQILISSCGHLAYCLGMTSFGGKGIDAKFTQSQGNDPNFQRYIALKEHTTSIIDKSDRSALHYNGQSMSRQSYACLSDGYWIEVNDLGKFKGDCKLSPESLELVQTLVVEKHKQFRTSVRRRSKPQSKPFHPLLSPKASLAVLASPTAYLDTHIPMEIPSSDLASAQKYIERMPTFTCYPDTANYYHQSWNAWAQVWPYLGQSALTAAR